ncbi:MAG: hypothetical protein WBQ43_05045 [Terriglobales bacterium]
MAFLDFINNRQGQRAAGEQQSQPQKSEPTKEMSTRGAVKENAPAKQFENMRPDQQAKVAEAQTLFRQGTQETAQAPSAPAQAPADSTESPQVMAQKSMNQDKAAPALSPTSAQKGTRATEKDSPAPAQEPTAQSKERSQEQTRQTIARRPPSWER